MKSIIISFLTVALLQILNPSFAQTTEEIYKRGLLCKEQYKDKEGLTIFQLLLKGDSNKVEYLYNASDFYSRIGNTFPKDKEKEKNDYYKTSEYLAKKAIASNEKEPEAHYAYAQALGRLSEHASNKHKIVNAKLIKTETERCLALNPKHDGAWHILGRWHREVAGFGSVEKFMMKTLYGSALEGASYEQALDCFNKAKLYNPKYMRHVFELAQTYYDMGDKVRAKVWFEKVTQMPVVTIEDAETIATAKKMVGKL